MFNQFKPAEEEKTIPFFDDVKAPDVEVKKEYPTQATLDKYGLSRVEVKSILESQGNKCPVCKNTPSSGIWHIDHVHAKGWKKMPPEKRKMFVRGLLCQFCNRFYLAKRMTVEKAKNIITYLEEFERRKP